MVFKVGMAGDGVFVLNEDKTVRAPNLRGDGGIDCEVDRVSKQYRIYGYGDD